MKHLNVERMRAIVDEHKPPCVSIYMPTYRGGSALEENRIRLKNLTGQALERLMQRGFRRPDAERLIEPIRDYLEHGIHRQPTGDALGLLTSPGQFEKFTLPFECEEIVSVCDRAHVAPLLSMTDGDDLFYVLALSQNSVRLYRRRDNAMEQIASKDIPSSLADVLRYDDRAEHLQLHTRAQPHAEGRAAMYHGQGEGKDEHHTDMARFCQAVDEAVTRTIGDRQAPLVIAAAEELAVLYKSVTAYPNTVAESIAGNPEHTPAQELSRKVAAIVDSRMQARRRELVQRFQQAGSKGLGSSRLQDILPVVENDRVETLLVGLGRRIWGRFDPETGETERADAQAPDSEDLINRAVVESLRHGAAVCALPPCDMPHNASLAAVFRF